LFISLFEFIISQFHYCLSLRVTKVTELIKPRRIYDAYVV